MVVSLVISMNHHPANESCDKLCRFVILADQHAERLPSALVAFTSLDGAFEQLRQQSVDESHLSLSVCNRILAEVEAVRERIGIVRLGVFIGRVVEARFTAAHRDLGQLGVLVTGHDFVAVLDGPVIVGTDRRGVVSRLLRSCRDDVHRQVVHHAADGRFVGFGGVFHFGERLPSTRSEIVTQAECVANLVHDDFLERLLQILFGQLAPFGGESLRGKDGSGEAALMLHSFIQAAIGMTLPTRPEQGRGLREGWLFEVQQRGDGRRREVLVASLP